MGTSVICVWKCQNERRRKCIIIWILLYDSGLSSPLYNNSAPIETVMGQSGGLEKRLKKVLTLTLSFLYTTWFTKVCIWHFKYLDSPLLDQFKNPISSTQSYYTSYVHTYGILMDTYRMQLWDRVRKFNIYLIVRFIKTIWATTHTSSSNDTTLFLSKTCLCDVIHLPSIPLPSNLPRLLERRHGKQRSILRHEPAGSG